MAERGKMTIPFELNRTHCIDCLEAMKLLQDKSVDLVLTDPPYGIGEAAGKNKSRGHLARSRDYGNATWDNQRIDVDILQHLLRVGTNAIVFGGNYYADLLPPSSCWIVWDKVNYGNDFADCELAWTSFTSAVRYFKYQWNGMLQEDMKNKEQRVHPTQKPVALFRWIIEKYTKPNDLVLDPFMGSGTTGIAAIQTGRRFLSFEINPEYAKLANDRCEAARRGLTLNEHRDGQQSLFGVNE